MESGDLGVGCAKLRGWGRGSGAMGVGGCGFEGSGGLKERELGLWDSSCLKDSIVGGA